MSKIYTDKDCNLELVQDKVICIVGYGNQGRAQALNMRDMGVKHIIVGSRKDGSYDQAVSDGFEVFPIEEAVKKADIIFMLLPDEFAPQIFNEQIQPNLKEGDIVNFASAYNVTFKHIVPPAFVDVVMAAPRMIGDGVRNMFLRGEGYPSFVGVAQDASGKALEYAKALAMAIGSTKKGAIEVTFDDETRLDLMAEQGVWPIIYNVFHEAYQLLKENGHPVEAILFEAYLSKEPMYMFEKAADLGMFKQLPFHSHTSQYGQLTNFFGMDTAPIRAHLEKAYDDIASGRFAEAWEKEQKEYNLENMFALQKKVLESDFTKDEEKTQKALL